MVYDDRIMRMAGSVPQRTVQSTTSDVAGPRGRTVGRPGPPSGPPSNIGFDRAGPYPFTPMEMKTSGFRSPSNIGYDRAGPSGPPSNIGFDRMGGIFSGRNAGSDMMSDYYNNQLGWADQLQGAIGGEGDVIPAGYPDSQTAKGRGLWKQANRNVNPEGKTPLPVIIKEWERLKEEFYRLKAQGYRPGND